MGYKLFFKTIFRASIILGFIWLFIYISPDNCTCSSKLLHNSIWGLLGFLMYVSFAVFIANMGSKKSLPDRIFFKLFRIPKPKYKYEIIQYTAPNGQTLYIPTVKTTWLYPPFYIKVDGNEYELIDPAKDNKYYSKSKEGALYAISLVKNDMNNKTFKYKCDMWMCYLCPLKSDCYQKEKIPSDLTVKISKTFNK